MGSWPAHDWHLGSFACSGCGSCPLDSPLLAAGGYAESSLNDVFPGAKRLHAALNCAQGCGRLPNTPWSTSQATDDIKYSAVSCIGLSAPTHSQHHHHLDMIIVTCYRHVVLSAYAMMGLAALV